MIEKKRSDYTAKKIVTTLKVDGNIKKPIWQDAKWSKRFVNMVSGDAGMYNTQTAILWIDTHLYITFEAEQPCVKAKLTKIDSILFLERMKIIEKKIGKENSIRIHNKIN